MKQLLAVFILLSAAFAQTCNTSSKSLPDVGAQVAACIADIHTGKVVIDQGGTWAQNVVVPSGISLVYAAGALPINNGMGSRQPILSMSSHDYLHCESQENTIGAPSVGDETIICGVHQGPNCSNTAEVITDVKVNGCHFVSQGSGGSPLSGAIWLENCAENCETDYNFFDGIKTIAILIGASSFKGNHSIGYDASHNLISGWSNAGIALINASQSTITYNRFRKHGSGAAGAIDVEPNAATDWADNNDIGFNFDDATTNSLPFRDYGITFQCAGYTRCLHNRIHGNTLWGGAPGSTFTGLLNQGISVEGSHQEVDGNFVSNTNSTGYSIVGDHGKFYDNTGICTAYAVFGISPTLTANHNLIERNTIDNTPCHYSPYVLGAYSTMRENVNGFVNSNTFRNNFGFTGYALTPNDGSVVIP